MIESEVGREMRGRRCESGKRKEWRERKGNDAATVHKLGEKLWWRKKQRSLFLNKQNPKINETELWFHRGYQYIALALFRLLHLPVG